MIFQNLYKPESIARIMGLAHTAPAPIRNGSNMEYDTTGASK